MHGIACCYRRGLVASFTRESHLENNKWGGSPPNGENIDCLGSLSNPRLLLVVPVHKSFGHRPSRKARAQGLPEVARSILVGGPLKIVHSKR